VDGTWSLELDLFDNPAVDVGQEVVLAAVTDGEGFVVDSPQPEDVGVEILMGCGAEFVFP
jgi:hypothetical protein